MRRSLAAAGLWLGLAAGAAQAAPIHYWQFEDSPGFLEDSAGSFTLTAVGSPTQVTLPASGRGSTFDDAVWGNASAVDLDGGDYLTSSSFSLSTFTVEALAHFDTVGVSGSGDTIAGVANSYTNVEVAWLFQVRDSQLTLVLCSGWSCELLYSGFSVVTGKDYFFAAAVDLAGSEATLYAQNLTDGGLLQSTTLSHSKSTLNTPTASLIGFSVRGLIDEVRISDTVLGEEALLINQVPVPEPSTLSLLAVGTAALALTRRGRRART